MRKIFTLIASMLFTATVLAQSPQKMSYQEVIRDGSALVTGQSVPMEINIWRDAAGVGGTNVYTEIPNPTPATNGNGVVSIEIGSGNPVTFKAIDWSAGNYFIETKTDLGGGNIITNTSQLLSLPFALYAKTAGGHFVGELYGGGIVVAVSKNAGIEHGLIASLTNLGPDPGSPWCDIIYIETLIGPTSQNLIDGVANTIAIIAQSPAYASAAKLCSDYRGGGFSDWYLPAIQELKEFYKALYNINNILAPGDGFHFDNYWSSTENMDDFAGLTSYFIGFHVGMLNPGGHKGHLLRVRAVRKF